MSGLLWGSCGLESLWIHYVDAPALVTVAAVGFDFVLLLKPIVLMRYLLFDRLLFFVAAATIGHTALTKLIHEECQHQCHYQDQYDTGGAPKVEGNNGLTIGF